MIFQHHLQSCGQVWNFGTSQPQHRGVESNGMQGWERRQDRQDMESRPTMQLWHSPASTRALEEFSCRTCQLIQKTAKLETFFQCVCVCLCTTVHATCSPISNNLLEWSIPALLLDSSATLRYLGTLLLTSVPSQLLTVAKISSNLLATDVEWIWKNDNESNSKAMLLLNNSSTARLHTSLELTQFVDILDMSIRAGPLQLFWTAFLAAVIGQIQKQCLNHFGSSFSHTATTLESVLLHFFDILLRTKWFTTPCF